MATAREVIRGLLAQAMRASMHLPQHVEDSPQREVVLQIPGGAPQKEMGPLHHEFPDSWIEALDYDPRTKQLTLWMRGTNYEYGGVEQGDVDGFLSAEDPGDYYHNEFHSGHSSQ